MNSVANGKVPRALAVQPRLRAVGGGDAGGAIGAAFAVWHKSSGDRPSATS